MRHVSAGEGMSVTSIDRWNVTFHVSVTALPRQASEEQSCRAHPCLEQMAFRPIASQITRTPSRGPFHFGARLSF